MTIITKIFCNICLKECHLKRYGVVSGCVLRMNDSIEPKEMIFEGHYCEEHISDIIKFIEINERDNRNQHDSEDNTRKK